MVQWYEMARQPNGRVPICFGFNLCLICPSKTSCCWKMAPVRTPDVSVMPRILTGEMVAILTIFPNAYCQELVWVMAWRRAAEEPLIGPIWCWPILLTYICIIRPQWATTMFPVCYISAPFMALCHNRCCHNQVCQLITLPQENYIIAPCMSNY